MRNSGKYLNLFTDPDTNSHQGLALNELVAQWQNVIVNNIYVKGYLLTLSKRYFGALQVL